MWYIIIAIIILIMGVMSSGTSSVPIVKKTVSFSSIVDERIIKNGRNIDNKVIINDGQ